MKTKDKIDVVKENKNDYVTPKKPVLLEIKPAVYLTISGQGEPGGAAFSQSIGALYAMAYTVKMTRKFAGEQDYTVDKLEGQWWGDDAGECFTKLPQNQWRWKLLIRTPDFVKPAELDKAVAALKKKGKTEPVDHVALERLEEGRCVQMLHVGPYEREGDTIAIMGTFAKSKGLELCGRHHEIYLSDPRRVAPEKLKTILRSPVRPREA